MSFPINIEKLLGGGSVEWERLEFKESWNPLEITHTITAFANDINNWGGGYIIVGIKEKDGRPVLPPKGINQNSIDKIQKDLLNKSNLIKPPYFPIAQPVEYMGKIVFLIWVPGSETRPHKAPKSFKKGSKENAYYIRRFASTVVANSQEEIDLIETSAKTPFDDQVNQSASLNDLNLLLIQNHLAAIGSGLLEDSTKLPFADLCRRMNIVNGPTENLLPKNIGLLLFNSDSAKFFKGARIDVIQFKDNAGSTFTERSFSGPIQQQLQDVLIFIKNEVVTERVVKLEGAAESIRAFNYPFEAIEEAIVNTVYHRSYSDDSPIEIRIFPERIDIISYPGPMPPMTKEKLREGKVTARKYRNSRMGDFLKELRLTEGRGTGIPTIIKSMTTNGSPHPVFETDDSLSYFLTTLKIHPSWQVEDGDKDGVEDGDKDGVEDNWTVEKTILNYCRRPKKRTEIMKKIKLFPNTKNYERHVKPLVDKGWLTPTVPDKPTSKYQQFRTTADGEKAMKGIELVVEKSSQASLFDMSDIRSGDE